MSKSGIIRILFFLFQSLAFHLLTIAQIAPGSEWIFMKGDTTLNNYGSYGSKGVASPTNKPGSREGCGMNWTDTDGNLWLYGDYGYAENASGYLSDLWKYDISSNQWTWMNGDKIINAPAVYGSKGIESPSNSPGARHLSTTWTDNNGNFWLFGGYNTSGLLNDLWKYDVLNNQWVWMSGNNTINGLGVYGTKGMANTGNQPGSRNRACRPDTRIDADGNLWLFGGTGYAASGNVGNLNDLWKYDIVHNQWTWMGGNTSINVTGVYGIQGIADSLNTPGARVGGVCWMDYNNDLWLFGGSGTSSGWSPKFNDLWKFDTQINQWVWMKGDLVTDQYGHYGLPGVEDVANHPGGRLMSLCWIDNAQNLWLFGGYGFSAAGTGNSTGTQGLNDLWKYDPFTNNWVWIKGDSIANASNVFGVPEVASAFNHPGNRSGTNQWNDMFGHFWLMGGIDWGGSVGFRNDLWMLDGSTVLATDQNELQAYRVKDGVHLQWSFSNATDAEKYEIQKGTATGQFHKISEIIAEPGHPLVWIDNSPAWGWNIYRVKMIQHSGRIVYTKSVRVRTDDIQADIRLYPNPVSGHHFSIETKVPVADNIRLLLYNTMGVCVYLSTMSWQENRANIQLPPTLPDGVYTMKLVNPSGQIIAQESLLVLSCR